MEELYRKSDVNVCKNLKYRIVTISWICELTNFYETAIKARVHGCFTKNEDENLCLAFVKFQIKKHNEETLLVTRIISAERSGDLIFIQSAYLILKQVSGSEFAYVAER